VEDRKLHRWQPGTTGNGAQTREGEVLVELDSGFVEFEVKGLVLAGGNAIGTPGPVTQVKGTLVCGPGSASPTVIDTPLVPLSAQGNAAGSFSSSTAGCSPTDVALLIRVSAGAWIGNGSVRLPYPPVSFLSNDFKSAQISTSSPTSTTCAVGTPK
jgi:hypothetical protein